VIGLIVGCGYGRCFYFVYNFHVPLALKVGHPCSGVGCDVALVSIVLCVGLMAIFVVLCFFSGFLSIGVYFAVALLWCKFGSQHNMHFSECMTG
jgi:hypothetical protein